MQNTLELGSKFLRRSVPATNGWTGRSMKLFKYERSTTSLAPPLGLATKNPLEHHSEGSFIGTSSMSLLSIASAQLLVLNVEEFGKQ